MTTRLGSNTDIHIKRIAQHIKEIGMMHAHQEPEYINREVIENEDAEEYCRGIDGKTSFIVIAEDGKELAGFLKVVIKEIEPFFKPNKVLYLDQIFVLENFRKRGVSKLLIAKAEELARSKKIKLLKARVYQFNAPAQQTLKSSNFKQLYSEYFKAL